MLLARLGLRTCEVVRLELEDIAWESGQFTIWGKGGRWSKLPLPPDVGEALAVYLQHDRSRCSTRRLFVTQRAPITGLSTGCAIVKTVTRALKKPASFLRGKAVTCSVIRWRPRCLAGEHLYVKSVKCCGTRRRIRHGYMQRWILLRCAISLSRGREACDERSAKRSEAVHRPSPGSWIQIAQTRATPDRIHRIPQSEGCRPDHYQAGCHLGNGVFERA
jgi:hypothetical protein